MTGITENRLGGFVCIVWVQGALFSEIGGVLRQHLFEKPYQ